MSNLQIALALFTTIAVVCVLLLEISDRRDSHASKRREQRSREQ